MIALLFCGCGAVNLVAACDFAASGRRALAFAHLLIALGIFARTWVSRP